MWGAARCPDSKINKAERLPPPGLTQLGEESKVPLDKISCRPALWRQRAQSFTRFISRDAYYSPAQWLSASLFYSLGNRGSEKFRKLPRFNPASRDIQNQFFPLCLCPASCTPALILITESSRVGAQWRGMADREEGDGDDRMGISQADKRRNGSLVKETV